MDRHKIIMDQSVLDDFINWLPQCQAGEFYLMILMARCKDGSIPRASNSEIFGTKRLVCPSDIQRTLIEWEVPVGHYKRNGSVIDDRYLSPYITINPRDVHKARAEMCMSLMDMHLNSSKKDVFGELFSIVHKSIGAKNFVDFDFDGVEYESISQQLSEMVDGNGEPVNFRVVKTKRGFHLVFTSKSLGENYRIIKSLNGCDVSGANNMIPIPGCNQRGFTPYFIV